MKKLYVLLALSGTLGPPALAQMTPAQTNLDQRAARLEARSAHGRQLTAVSAEQASANALKRCADLPAFYKSDCESRARGEGQTSGSVLGGGLIKETVTTMPAAELDALRQDHRPMTLPPPRR